MTDSPEPPTGSPPNYTALRQLSSIISEETQMDMARRCSEEALSTMSEEEQLKLAIAESEMASAIQKIADEADTPHSEEAVNAMSEEEQLSLAIAASRAEQQPSSSSDSESLTEYFDSEAPTEQVQLVIYGDKHSIYTPAGSFRTFNDLKALYQQATGRRLDERTIATRYTDDEGDMITISSDDELQEAVRITYPSDPCFHFVSIAPNGSSTPNISQGAGVPQQTYLQGQEAIYTFSDGTQEQVTILKCHGEGIDDGYTVWIPSLQRERHTVGERLRFLEADDGTAAAAAAAAPEEVAREELQIKLQVAEKTYVRTVALPLTIDALHSLYIECRGDTDTSTTATASAVPKVPQQGLALVIRYVDDEGDLITIGPPYDESVREAIEIMREGDGIPRFQFAARTRTTDCGAASSSAVTPPTSSAPIRPTLITTAPPAQRGNASNTARRQVVLAKLALERTAAAQAAKAQLQARERQWQTERAALVEQCAEAKARLQNGSNSGSSSGDGHPDFLAQNTYTAAQELLAQKEREWEQQQAAAVEQARAEAAAEAGLQQSQSLEKAKQAEAMERESLQREMEDELAQLRVGYEKKLEQAEREAQEAKQAAEALAKAQAEEAEEQAQHQQRQRQHEQRQQAAAEEKTQLTKDYEHVLDQYSKLKLELAERQGAQEDLAYQLQDAKQKAEAQQQQLQAAESQARRQQEEERAAAQALALKLANSQKQQQLLQAEAEARVADAQRRLDAMTTAVAEAEARQARVLAERQEVEEKEAAERQAESARRQREAELETCRLQQASQAAAAKAAEAAVEIDAVKHAMQVAAAEKLQQEIRKREEVWAAEKALLEESLSTSQCLAATATAGAEAEAERERELARQAREQEEAKARELEAEVQRRQSTEESARQAVATLEQERSKIHLQLAEERAKLEHVRVEAEAAKEAREAREADTEAAKRQLEERERQWEAERAALQIKAKAEADELAAQLRAQAAEQAAMEKRLEERMQQRIEQELAQSRSLVEEAAQQRLQAEVAEAERRIRAEVQAEAAHNASLLNSALLETFEGVELGDMPSPVAVSDDGPVAGSGSGGLGAGAGGVVTPPGTPPMTPRGSGTLTSSAGAEEDDEWQVVDEEAVATQSLSTDAAAVAEIEREHEQQRLALERGADQRLATSEALISDIKGLVNASLSDDSDD